MKNVDYKKKSNELTHFGKGGINCPMGCCSRYGTTSEDKKHAHRCFRRNDKAVEIEKEYAYGEGI